MTKLKKILTPILEICLYGDLIEFFESQRSELKVSRDLGVGSQLSFTNIFSDIRTAMDAVHLGGQLKQKTLENMDKYIKKTKAAVLFHRMRKAGKKLFLITNSEFYYTEKVMSFLLSSGDPQYKSWRDYFGMSSLLSLFVDCCENEFWN